MSTATHTSKYHIKIKTRCKTHVVLLETQLPIQRTIHKLIVIQHDPSSKTRFIWIRIESFPGRQFKRLARQIAIKEIGLHGVSWIFKLKMKIRDLYWYYEHLSISHFSIKVLLFCVLVVHILLTSFIEINGRIPMTA